jgi:hypothetical protein
MRQLTSLDQQFLALEDGRTHGHVSVLAHTSSNETRPQFTKAGPRVRLAHTTV